MLELRVTAAALRIASLREAIRRECERADAGSAHAAMVTFVAEQLVDANGGAGGGRRRAGRSSEVLVLVTVQSDATMLMVRDPRPDQVELGERRHRMLQECTSRWSTMSGRDGRTVWAEIARAPRPAPEVEPAAPAAVPVDVA